jgi:hypothetical protein
VAADVRLCKIGGAVFNRRLSSSSPSLPLAFKALTLGAVLTVTAASGCTKKIITQAGPNGTPTEEGTRRESVPCKKGNVTLPIEAFDINPGEASGTACNVEKVLDDDGSFAALDWPGTETHKLAGRDVTGCLAAEFGEGITLESLSMKMRAVGAGCGHACSEGDDGCGSGWDISLFAGPSLGKLQFVQRLSLTTADPFEYKVVIYEAFKAKFVALCREPTPNTGDDIAIDALSGVCR